MKKFENVEVAWLLDEIANLLVIKGEDNFKIRAYQRAARTIENLPQNVAELFNEKKLSAIPGVGKNIGAKLEELFNTGKIEYLDNLRAEVPRGVTEMTMIPGVGPKMALTLFNKLGIKSIAELEQAARDRKIRTVPGLGNKTELNILRGIELMKSGGGRTTLGVAWAVAEGFIGFFRNLPGVVQVEAGGSTRRMKEAIGDIDIVVSSESPDAVTDLFVKHPQVKEVLAQGDTKTSVLLKFGVQVDLRVVKPDEFWSAWHHFTGSKEHNVRLRERSHKYGVKINEYGLFDTETGKRLPVDNEADIYQALGLKYIPPELREDRGEIEAAEKNEVPKLVELSDIMGDLHLHSNWSDGVNTIEQIAAQAETLKYQYVAISDHSKSLAIARGLPTEKVLEQNRYIDDINNQGLAVKVLKGIEADILSNGALDYPDEVLAEKDVVVASIHSGFRQDREKITDRIVSAIKNEHVDIIAHPTGRLVGRRDPYDVDLERVFEAAAKYGTVLEINASPDRLDLNDVNVRRAKEMGLKIAINTDAHEVQRMLEMRFGVGTARRGWLTADDVINTMSYSELKEFLGRKR